MWESVLVTTGSTYLMLKGSDPFLPPELGFCSGSEEETCCSLKITSISKQHRSYHHAHHTLPAGALK